jgi:hypothetical protein
VLWFVPSFHQLCQQSWDYANVHQRWDFEPSAGGWAGNL